MSFRSVKVLFAVAIAMAAASPLHADSTDSAKVAEEVAKDVKDLATAEKTDAAEIRLMAGGADTFIAIQAAASHENLPPKETCGSIRQGSDRLRRRPSRGGRASEWRERNRRDRAGRGQRCRRAKIQGRENARRA